MKYKEWIKLIRKHLHKDLNGKVIVYDIDDTALGEVVYKKGVVVSRRKYGIKEKRLAATNKEV